MNRLMRILVMFDLPDVYKRQPDVVRIELAREMSRTFDERRKMEKRQDCLLYTSRRYALVRI